jgi:hypothetical protein
MRVKVGIRTQGKRWIYNTYQQWITKEMPWLSYDQFKRKAIESSEEEEVLEPIESVKSAIALMEKHSNHPATNRSLSVTNSVATD